jgi:hypothetical protein
MNDFTKEELYDLQSWGDAYTSYDLESDIYKIHEPLLTKIQSMIDNYCDDGDDIKESIYPHKECEICHQLVWGNYECPCGTRL